MTYLDEGSFLVKLSDLYAQTRTTGSVWVGMKRYVGRLAATRRRRPARQLEAAKGQEPRCLVRARSSAKKSKISTIIGAKDCARFQVALGNIIAMNMDGLKTRSKKERDAQPKAPKKVKKDGAGTKEGSKDKRPKAEGADTAGADASGPAPKQKPKKKK